MTSSLERAVVALQDEFPGPGGACAVLREGEVLVSHAWGFINAERRIRFTPTSLFRFCSITKQFTCALVLDGFPDPSVLDGDVAASLPGLTQAPPRAVHLCHNQSGLRDYWAEAMLHGSPVEAPFGEEEALAVIGRMRRLHFVPGTRYSYVNQNFRLLANILQQRSGRSLAELLRTRIFERVGMGGAVLAADTSALPDGGEGYEGSVAAGFRAAVNRVLWTGDAGLGASLEDMIAWEKFVDATRDDPDSLYRRLSAPVAFADGTPARYGFGLGRSSEFGRAATGHGGALRGWRSHRLNLAAERISVVVMFNHLSDAHAAAQRLLGAVLGEAVPPLPAPLPAPEWCGAYTEPESGLAVRIGAAAPGTVRLRFGHRAEHLTLLGDGTATDGSVTLRPVPEGLRMERPGENMASVLRPCRGAISRAGLAGQYRCEETGAELTVADAGGVLYGAFSGFLGRGRMERLEPAGPDLWMLPCPRALDHTPPGDWTLAFSRAADGAVDGVRLGCWLARGLEYRRVAGKAG